MSRKCPLCGEELVPVGKKFFPEADPQANDYIVQCPSEDCPAFRFTRFRYTMKADTVTRADELIENVRELEQKLQGKHYDFLNAAAHARKREMEADRLAAEYRRVHGYKSPSRSRMESSHFAGSVSDDPRTDARAARVAGLTGYYEANTLILMRRTGLTRTAAVSLPCGKADEILKGIKQ